MQHLLDLARPYWPLILALVVWPLVSAVLTYALWWDTPARWDAFVTRYPRAAFAVRILRAMSPHLRKLVVAWRDLAASRSALPLSALAEKQGAIVVSETRPHNAALRALGPVVVDPRKSDTPPSFDPSARQTIVPEVAADVQRAAGSAHPAQVFSPAFRDPGDGQRGSADVRALLAVVVGLSVVLPLGVALYGCPRLPPVSGCQPEAQTCLDDAPHVCSASQRWHRAGDLSCAAVGGVCTVLGSRAFCAPVADGGVR